METSPTGRRTVRLLVLRLAVRAEPLGHLDLLQALPRALASLGRSVALGDSARAAAGRPGYSSCVLMSALSPCAIWISFELLSVHAVRSVTASMTSRALG